MPETINFGNVSIVLCRPRYPENIGAAARAMRNMGFVNLRVVDPKDCDLTRILKLATHAAADLIENMEIFQDLGSALAPFHYVVGTTARLGGQRRTISSPGKLARDLVPISRKNRIALVFGPEDRGLCNAEIRYCHALVTIPTSGFASLNLAQAVMIICYELFTAAGGEAEDYTPRLATRHELEGMYAQLKGVLIRISFINPENPEYWMNNLRHFFSRLQLRAKDVRIIRGICRQIDWYAKKNYEDGRGAC